MQAKLLFVICLSLILGRGCSERQNVVIEKETVPVYFSSDIQDSLLSIVGEVALHFKHYPIHLSITKDGADTLVAFYVGSPSIEYIHPEKVKTIGATIIDSLPVILRYYDIEIFSETNVVEWDSLLAHTLITYYDNYSLSQVCDRTFLSHYFYQCYRYKDKELQWLSNDSKTITEDPYSSGFETDTVYQRILTDYYKNRYNSKCGK